MERIFDLIEGIQGVAAKLRSLKVEEIEKNKDFSDISFTGFRYIEAIELLEGPTLVVLAEHLKLSKPTVTVMVSKLVEGGFVVKQKSNTDARQQYLFLTRKGKSLIRKHQELFETYASEVANRLSEDELITLISLLKKM
jgi:DNA-binding MarR family transcriptional regulator